MKSKLIVLSFSLFFLNCTHSQKNFCVENVIAKKKISDQQIQDIQDPKTLQVLQENSPVSQQARVVPERDPKSGAIYGYKFVEIQPNSIFEQMGFRTEDIIIGVNNKTITKPRDAMEMYNALQGGEPLSIHMVRNGKEVVLPFQ